MIQAILKKGKVLPESVPTPSVSKGSLLIKVVNSCISAGTELSGVSESKKSIIQKALDQPEKIQKVLNIVKTEGIISAFQKVKGKLDSGRATGYSISGVVIGIGDGVSGFQIGESVAAAGAGMANHAEYVDVPVNLVIKLPKGMDFKLASTVTLGGIALQGVRRADLKLGEFCVVVGAGILGLISIQLLKLSGIRVIAIDLDDSRLKIAKECGAELILNPKKENLIKSVENLTSSNLADAVLFTAATTSSEPLSQAFQMCKKKGKVVLVGVVGMEIKREDMYTKELDFLISTSYGPGRYDTNYEQKGLDYPYAYVRWTENRNMQEYLRLVHDKKINLESLISEVFPIEEVEKAFQSLTNSEIKPLMVLLDYGMFDESKLNNYLNHDRKITVSPIQTKQGIIKVGVIGTGEFAAAIHLPNLRKLSNKYSIHAVMSRTGHKAKSIAEQFGASFSTTKVEDIINNKEIGLVMICTRHDSHAELVMKSLKSGKHVFVEKPLAISKEELEDIRNFYAENTGEQKPLLAVGFNRRFSNYLKEIKSHTSKRINPLFVTYRMNAGYIPSNHWVHEDGGRIIGEACHIIDIMNFLTESEIESVSCESLNPNNEKFIEADNKSIILKYKDGSVCNIGYFSVGSKQLSKEYMEIHFDEKSIVMDDYKSIKGFGIKINELTSSSSEKGQLQELEFLYDSLTGKTQNWPIELWDIIQTTEISLAIK